VLARRLRCVLLLLLTFFLTCLFRPVHPFIRPLFTLHLSHFGAYFADISFHISIHFPRERKLLRRQRLDLIEILSDLCDGLRRLLLCFVLALPCQIGFH
jgi:hypothetical protein